MKNLFVIAVAIFIATLNGYAQLTKTQIDSIILAAVPKEYHSQLFRETGTDRTTFRIEAAGSMNRLAASNLSQPVKPEGSLGLYVNRNLLWSLWETGLKWNWRQYDMTGFIPQYAPGMTKFTASANTLEIPLTFGFLMEESKNIKYVVKAGMYFEFGLFGNGTQYTSNEDGTETAVKISNIYKSQLNFNPFQRFDVGGRLGIDIYLNKWKVGFEYTHGWRDIQTNWDRHIKNKNLTLSVGYFFKTKEHKKRQPDFYLVY